MRNIQKGRGGSGFGPPLNVSHAQYLKGCRGAGFSPAIKTLFSHLEGFLASSAIEATMSKPTNEKKTCEAPVKTPDIPKGA